MTASFRTDGRGQAYSPDIPADGERNLKMRIAHMLAAAGLVLGSLGAATAADAQNYRNDSQYQNDRHDGRGERSQNDRSDHRDQRYLDHRRYGNDQYHETRDHWRDRRDRRYEHRDRHRHDWRGYNRCHIEWRHHRRVRICR